VTHADAPPLDRHDLRRVVAVLCAGQITTWGVLFYAFPVLATSMADDEGWTLTTLVAVFTGAQVVAAACGILVGRVVDHRGPRLVMAMGSVVGTLAIVVVSRAGDLGTLALGFALAGIAMSATLYPPAFAAVTHWAGERRVAALTAITLVGGLASTVFAPLAAVLESVTDWRTAYLVLAVPLAATAALHWFGLGAPWPTSPHDPAMHPDERFRLRADPVVRSRRYLAVWLAMTVGGFSVYAVVINLVPLLEEGGLTTTLAAVALGVGGIGQVLGRLLYQRLLGPLTPAARLTATLAAAALTTALIAVARSPLAVVLLVCLAAGLARGVFTLVQATAVSDRWGTSNYGARSSLLSGSTTVAAASAPWAGAAGAAALGSYQEAFLVLAAVGAAAALVSLAEPRPHVTGVAAYARLRPPRP